MASGGSRARSARADVDPPPLLEAYRPECGRAVERDRGLSSASMDTTQDRLYSQRSTHLRQRLVDPRPGALRDSPAAGGALIASLDHAMWFHRPPDFSDWLLYDRALTEWSRRPRAVQRRDLQPVWTAGMHRGPRGLPGPRLTFTVPRRCRSSSTSRALDPSRFDASVRSTTCPRSVRQTKDVVEHLAREHRGGRPRAERPSTFLASPPPSSATNAGPPHRRAQPVQDRLRNPAVSRANHGSLCSRLRSPDSR